MFHTVLIAILFKVEQPQLIDEPVKLGSNPGSANSPSKRAAKPSDFFPWCRDFLSNVSSTNDATTCKKLYGRVSVRKIWLGHLWNCLDLGFANPIHPTQITKHTSPIKLMRSKIYYTP